MHWNHRIVRVKDNDEERLMFAEVYYNDDGSLMGYGECFMYGDDMGELRQLVNRLGNAINQPVLNDTDFPKEQFDAEHHI